MNTGFTWILDSPEYRTEMVSGIQVVKSCDGRPFKYWIFQSDFQTTNWILDHLTTKHKSTIWKPYWSGIQIVNVPAPRYGPTYLIPCSFNVVIIRVFSFPFILGNDGWSSRCRRFVIFVIYKKIVRMAIYLRSNILAILVKTYHNHNIWWLMLT